MNMVLTGLRVITLLSSVLLVVLTGLTVNASEHNLKIGIIGAGKIGGTLGELWAAAGHSVFLSSRHPEQLKPLAEKIGTNAQYGSPRQAAAFGEVVLISVPYGALPQIGSDYGQELEGKIVLETGNPFPGRDGDMAVTARAKGTGDASAEFLPGVRLVRAFNTIPYYDLRSEAHRSGSRVAVPLAGDDDKALDTAVSLVRDAGFEAVIVGPLSQAEKFDVGTSVFAKALTADELRQSLELAAKPTP